MTDTEFVPGYLDALEREKAGYTQAGKPERAKDVDAEIARLKGADRRTKAKAADAPETTEA